MEAVHDWAAGCNPILGTAPAHFAVNIPSINLGIIARETGERKTARELSLEIN